jgi:hypothetical protein
MKTILYKFPFYLISLLFSTSIFAADTSFGSIEGSTNVVCNESVIYSLNGILYSNPDWRVTNGSISTNSGGSISINWDCGATSGNIKFYDGRILKAELNVNILSPPSAPSSSDKDRCGTGTVTFYASGAPSGGNYRWYSSSSSGSVLHTGSSFTTPSLSSSKYYWVSVINSYNHESSRTRVQAIIYSKPSAPSASNKSRCGSGTVNLGASGAPSGGNYRWYGASSGGSVLKTGSGYSPTVSSSRSYYVSAVSSQGCEGPRKRVIVTINPVPSVSVSNSARCGTGKVTLTASGAGNGDEYQWFDSSSSGLYIVTGSSFTTPNLSSSKDYWVRIVTAEGCTTSKQKATAIIRSLPGVPTASGDERCGTGNLTLTASGAPSGGGYRWYAASNLSNIIGTSSSLLVSNLSSTKDYVVRYVDSHGCLGGMKTVTAKINTIPGAPSASNKSRCGSGTVNLSASGAPSGGNYRWYGASSGGSVLKTGSSYSPSPSSSRSYYVSAVSSQGCEGLRRKVDITVNPVPSVSVSNSARCGTGKVTLTASGGRSGSQYEWFESSTGGSPVATGATFITPTLSSSKDYWVGILTYEFCRTDRQKATAIIRSLPGIPTASGDERCGTGNLTLTASGAPSGGGYRWYEASNLNNVISTSSSHTVNNLSSTKDYVVRYVNAYGCEGGTKTVTAKINTIPGAPSASNKSRCGSGTVNLSASGAPSGGNYLFHSASSGGSVLKTGSGYSPTVSSSRSYYVSAVSSQGCEGPRKQVIVTVNTVPSVSVSNSERCGTGTVTLTASGAGSGDEYKWFDSSSGGLPIATGSSFTTPNLSSSTDYWVRIVTAAGCTSDIQQATATVHALPDIPTASGDERCGPGDLTLTASGAPYGGGYQWYEAFDLNNVISTSSNLTVHNLSSTKNYVVRYFNEEGCLGPAKSVKAKINDIPSAPSVSNESRCGPGAVNLTASGAPDQGGYNWYNTSSSSTILESGSNYQPSVNNSRSFYVAAVSEFGCEGPRRKIDVTLNEVPVFELTSTKRCEPGQFLLKAVTDAENVTFDWFESETSIEVIGDSQKFFTPPISENRDYWVVVTGENGCSSPRTKVTTQFLNSSDFVNVTSGQDKITTVAGETVTLSVDPVDDALDYNWYLGSPSGPLVNTGLTYTVDVYSNKDYYVTAVFTDDGCESSESYKVSQVLVEGFNIESYDDEHYLQADDTILLTANDTFENYTWYKDGDSIASSQSLEVTQAGKYQLKVSFNLNNEEVTFYSDNSYYVFEGDANNDAQHQFSRSIEIREEGVKTLEDLAQLSQDKKNEVINYFDSAGRLSQTVAVQASPAGNDIIQYFEYGNYNRQSKNYMPAVVDTGEVGSFRENAIDLIKGFYDTNNDGIANTDFPFSEVVYDNTPYERVMEKGHVGESWQIVKDPEGKSNGTGNTIKKSHRFTNVSDLSVRKWASNGTSSGTYATGELYKVTVENEDGKTYSSYVNEAGEQVLSESADGSLTYYIYDDFGRINYIVPPLAVEKMTDNSTFDVGQQSELVYQFTYDPHSRLVERKVPGKAAEFIVYDHWDRPLLTQNALMRKENKWYFVKYDQEHRPIMSGVYTNTTDTTRESIQALINTLDFNNSDQYYEVRSNATTLGYTTDQSFPSQNIEVRSLNYYDHYDFNLDGTADYAYDSSQLSLDAAEVYDKRGRATASRTRVLGTDDWLIEVYFYDEKGRLVQKSANNIQNSAVADIQTIQYDWEGKMNSVRKVHSGAEQITTEDIYHYDNRGLLTHISQVAGNNPEQDIVHYEYNELGQVIEKNLHGSTEFLQSVDYTYHIRGWLKSINGLSMEEESNAIETDFYGMEFQYENSAENQYDGNISSISWRNGVADTASTYDYTYDASGRMTVAAYSQEGGSHSGAFGVSVGYDANGNITSLNRYSPEELMDELSYTYAHNQLMAVTDSASAKGFNDQNTSGDDYAYDENGNLISDHNKGISEISYTFFDKPARILFADSSSIGYTYGADGSKLRQVYYDAGGNVQKQTDYIGAITYENQSIQFVSIPEGRLVKDVDSIGQWTDMCTFDVTNNISPKSIYLNYGKKKV